MKFFGRTLTNIPGVIPFIGGSIKQALIGSRYGKDGLMDSAALQSIGGGLGAVVSIFGSFEAGEPLFGLKRNDFVALGRAVNGIEPIPLGLLFSRFDTVMDSYESVEDMSVAMKTLILGLVFGTGSKRLT